MTQLVPINSTTALMTQGQTKPHLTREEVIQLIQATDNPTHRILFRLLWGLGCRISELVGDSVAKPPITGVLVSDFFKRGSDYKLRLQRLKRRDTVYDEVIIPFDLGLATEDYIRVMNKRPEDKIIKFSRRRAYQIVRTEALRVLGEAKCHPHMFRHGFVYEGVRSGTHPYVLSSLVGHASINSTMAYFHASDEQLAQVRGNIAI